MVLSVSGRCATNSREPRQARNGTAISDAFVSWFDPVCMTDRGFGMRTEKGCTTVFSAKIAISCPVISPDSADFYLEFSPFRKI